jgi:hypothetical protein
MSARFSEMAIEEHEDMTMTEKEMRDYLGDKVIKLIDVEGQPWTGVIEDVFYNRFDKPCLRLADGTFQIGVQNGRTLAHAFDSINPADWIGKRVEIYAGELRDMNGQWMAAACIRSAEPKLVGGNGAQPAIEHKPVEENENPVPPDYEGEIPF